jgi:hypothetical protein
MWKRKKKERLVLILPSLGIEFSIHNIDNSQSEEDIH